MFCPHCGKKINDEDNFCKYCGFDLRDDEGDVSITYETQICEPQKQNLREMFDDDEEDEAQVIQTMQRDAQEDEADDEILEEDFDRNEENEIVVYEIKKHPMALFWPCVFSPILLAYFWLFYVNIPTFYGFLLAIVFLMPIIYPILRQCSDRSVVTTSNLHIRQGVFYIEDICIPLRKIHLVRLRRSFLGRIAGYGHIVIEKENSDKEITYRYIQEPDDVEFVLRNPSAYIKEYLKK